MVTERAKINPDGKTFNYEVLHSNYISLINTQFWMGTSYDLDSDKQLYVVVLARLFYANKCVSCGIKSNINIPDDNDDF